MSGQFRRSIALVRWSHHILNLCHFDLFRLVSLLLLNASSSKLIHLRLTLSHYIELLFLFISKVLALTHWSYLGSRFWMILEVHATRAGVSIILQFLQVTFITETSHLTMGLSELIGCLLLCVSNFALVLWCFGGALRDRELGRKVVS